MALLLITHDLNVVRNPRGRVGVMRFGEIVEMDEPERIFLRPRRTYTKALLASAPARRPAKPACRDDLLLQGRGICVRYARKRTWLWGARNDYLAVDRASIACSEDVHWVWLASRGRARAVWRLPFCV